MEVPENLKELFNHWEYQIERSKHIKKLNLKVDDKLILKISEFMTERQLIWQRKVQGQTRPYTQDQILQNYRFCNIYRELDKQTIEFHSMLKPLTLDFELWLLNMMYCRFVSNPQTVLLTGLLNLEDNQDVMTKLLNLPSPKYGSAYIFPISIIQRSEYDTREKFFTKYLGLKVKECAMLIQSFDAIGVSEALKMILPIFGFNFKFHWTEILIDIAYQYPKFVNLFKQFPIGPGSMPTIKSLNSKEDSELVCLSLLTYRIDNFPCLKYKDSEVKLSAENWEGIGCEYRKYVNLRNGDGRKRRYHNI